MTFDPSTATTGGGFTAKPALISAFAAGAATLLTRSRANGASWLRRLQLARMKSVLMSMSDEQLAQVGITRKEISRYAEKLTSEQQDG